MSAGCEKNCLNEWNKVVVFYPSVSLDEFYWSKVQPNQKLQDMILAMSNCDPWDDAKLGDALVYVRKSCLLKIPESFRDMISQL